MKNISFLIVILLLTSACSNSEKKVLLKKESKYYSVQLNFDSEDNLLKTKEELEQAVKDTLITSSDKSLLIGQFETFNDASDKGFELFADSLISEYLIHYSDTVLNNDYDEFYFIGIDLGRPALYKTSLFDIKPKLVWSKWGREIIKLSRSENRNNFYFTTCLTKGIRGSFPYVWNARLYQFQRVEETINFIQKFGKGVNFSSHWEDDSTFAVYFTILDSLLTSTFIQKVYTYNTVGEPRDTTEKVFELIKDGIPLPRFSQIEPFSPDHRYKIKVLKQDSIKTLNIIDELDASINLIDTLNGDLIETRWNDTSDFLFVTTRNTSASDSTNLLIIRLEDVSLIKKIEGVGEKNFVVIGNLLIYDNNFEKESFITFYRYKKNEEYAVIKIPGGCGIGNIPERNLLY